MNQLQGASSLGPTPLPLLADSDVEALAEVINVNLVGPFHLARALVGGMLLRGAGRVINISSDG